MRRALLIANAIVALFLLQTRAVAAGACVTDKFGGLVCGEGSDAMRVFADTISPSGQFAFAWRSPDGVAARDAPTGVENLLIRLSDGRALIKLGGANWATGEMRANRYDLSATWSPDSRAVVEVANDRWESESFAYYAIEGDRVRKLDLRALIEPAMQARLPPRQREGQSFRVREDLPIALDKHGRLRFTVMLYVPKSENSLDYRIQVNVSSNKGLPVAQIVSMRRVKGQ